MKLLTLTINTKMIGGVLTYYAEDFIKYQDSPMIP